MKKGWKECEGSEEGGTGWDGKVGRKECRKEGFQEWKEYQYTKSEFSKKYQCSNNTFSKTYQYTKSEFRTKHQYNRTTVQYEISVQ
jgi:hypothetical protein